MTEPRERVTAPRLHRRKVTEREIRLAQGRMWYRYWHCLGAMHKTGIAEVIDA